MSKKFIRYDIPTADQCAELYDGLDQNTTNFIESILLDRCSIGLPTSYEYLKELCDEMRSKTSSNALVS